MTGLTAAHIETALRAAGAGSGLCMDADAIAELFNDAMTTHGDGHFDSVDRVAALVSECMMESAYFRTTEEYGKDGRYKPYIGRSFIQITWERNYRAFGSWCHGKGLVPDPAYFVDQPSRLAEPRWAALGGVWYFTQVRFADGPLTAYAGDIRAVGCAVNLGDPHSSHVPAGQPARERAYRAFRALGPSIVPSPTPAPLTGRPFAMSGSKDVYLRFNGKQVLKAGENTVLINDKSDCSVVVGTNDGVDLLATLEVLDGAGQRYVGPVYSYFRVVSYLKDTPTTTVSSRAATSGDQVSYKGTIGAVETGRAPRLRLVLEVPPDAPAGLTLDTLQITGWTL